MFNPLKKSIEYTLVFASLVGLIISNERSINFVRGVFGVAFGAVLGYKIYGFSGTWWSLLLLGGCAFASFLIQVFPLHGLASIFSLSAWLAFFLWILTWNWWRNHEGIAVFVFFVVMFFGAILVFVAIGFTEHLVESLEAYVHRKVRFDLPWSLFPLHSLGLKTGVLSVLFMIVSGLVCATMGKIPFVKVGIEVGRLNASLIGTYLGGLIGVFFGSLVEATLLLHSAKMKQSSRSSNSSDAEIVVEHSTAHNTFSIILVTSLTWLTLEILGSIVQWIVQGWLNHKLNWFK